MANGLAVGGEDTASPFFVLAHRDPVISTLPFAVSSIVLSVVPPTAPSVVSLAFSTAFATLPSETAADATIWSTVMRIVGNGDEVPAPDRPKSAANGLLPEAAVAASEPTGTGTKEPPRPACPAMPAVAAVPNRANGPEVPVPDGESMRGSAVCGPAPLP